MVISNFSSFILYNKKQKCVKYIAQIVCMFCILGAWAQSPAQLYPRTPPPLKVSLSTAKCGERQQEEKEEEELEMMYT